MNNNNPHIAIFNSELRHRRSNQSEQSPSFSSSSSSSSLLSFQNGGILDSLQRSFSQNLHQKYPVQLPESLSIVAGVATFGSTLALSTWTQGRLLQISTGTPGPIPTLIGFATVCMASLASHHIACAVQDKCHQQMRQNRHKWWSDEDGLIYPLTSSLNDIRDNTLRLTKSIRTSLEGLSSDILDTLTQGPVRKRNWLRQRRTDVFDINGYLQIPVQTVGICAVGLIAFKLLGGRFWAISPSSYTHVGSFARRFASLPATEKYATTAERTAIERLGRKYGCHTCGSRMLGHMTKTSARFVGDHMPPKSVSEHLNSVWYRKLLKRSVQFRFFPQCIKCSNKQGAILAKAINELRTAAPGSRVPHLSRAGGGANAYFHGFRFRLHHLTGGVIAGIAVVGTPNAAFFSSSSCNDKACERYRQWYREITKRTQH